jgi:CheY-like chemotaxis protein
MFLSWLWGGEKSQKRNMSAAETLASSSSPILAGRRVLVIEDEYFLADDITRALRSFGAEIIGPIGEMEEASGIVERNQDIDAAVLDINLRSEMIFPIARALRSRDVPFVFTTGYDKSAIKPEFQDVPLWEKPLDIPDMARALSALILKRAH